MYENTYEIGKRKHTKKYKNTYEKHMKLEKENMQNSMK